MRSIKVIQQDIAAIKVAIREARTEGNEQEVDLFYEDLDELQEELHSAQTAVV
jgi:hypothetical protein